MLRGCRLCGIHLKHASGGSSQDSKTKSGCPKSLRVTLDLGYKRLFEGVQTLKLKYGPRPDVAALYRDLSVRVKEIASKTDRATTLIKRNEDRLDAEGITNKVSVSDLAVKINRWFGD